MQKNYLFILAGVVVAVLVIGAVFLFGRQDNSLPQSASDTKTANDARPDTANTKKNDLVETLGALTLTDFQGMPVHLADFSGKPLIVNSWAVWCPFCRKELPDFAALQKELGDRVAVIAIDRQESRETAKGYADELGIADNMIFLLDPSDSFYRAIGGFSMPETVFINSDGAIVFHKRGPMTLEEMQATVTQYLP